MSVYPVSHDSLVNSHVTIRDLLNIDQKKVQYRPKFAFSDLGFLEITESCYTGSTYAGLNADTPKQKVPVPDDVLNDPG